jgi:hypothetical protein
MCRQEHVTLVVLFTCLVYYNKTNGCVEVSCDVEFLENNGSQAEQVLPSVVGDGVSSQAMMCIGHIFPMETHEVEDQ